MAKAVQSFVFFAVCGYIFRENLASHIHIDFTCWWPRLLTNRLFTFCTAFTTKEAPNHVTQRCYFISQKQTRHLDQQVALFKHSLQINYSTLKVHMSQPDKQSHRSCETSWSVHKTHKGCLYLACIKVYNGINCSFALGTKYQRGASFMQIIFLLYMVFLH